MRFSKVRAKEGMKRVGRALDVFFLTPAAPLPLALLRIGLALVLMVQAYLLRHSLLDFFSQQGMIQGPLADYLGAPESPQILWLVSLLSPFNVGETACLYGTCTAYFVALVCFGLGFYTRASSIAVWFLHWVLLSSGFSTTYGVDIYAHVFLFYLMFMPCGDACSLDVLSGARTNQPTWMARLGLRVLQLHLCISYLASAIEKGSGVQWWNGEVLWRALNLPVYQQSDLTWLVHFPWLLKLGGWATLLFEAGYCAFIWPRATRRIWVMAITALHLGIIFFLGLELFGVVMCLLTISVFGFSAEPRTVAKEVPLPFRRLLTVLR
jgi:hypothetical protein